MIEGCPEAQFLALAAAKLGADPYELWHRGRHDLPPHPRPRAYRNLMYAMAEWVEERETEQQLESLSRFAALILGTDKKQRRRRGRRR